MVRLKAGLLQFFWEQRERAEALSSRYQRNEGASKQAPIPYTRNQHDGDMVHDAMSRCLLHGNHFSQPESDCDKCAAARASHRWCLHGRKPHLATVVSLSRLLAMPILISVLAKCQQLTAQDTSDAASGLARSSGPLPSPRCCPRIS